MNPYEATGGRAVVLRGDARQLPLPDESVDLICTSPPYYALRSYTDNGEHYDGQIGSEPTPGEYIDNLLDCTREWMRVLKPTGSIFVNLGDSYYSGKGAPGRTTVDRKNEARTARRAGGNPLDGPSFGIGRKSLLLVPERYRIACVDQLGLIARAVILWDKVNGMPESVTDRVRRSHEDWVHLTKEPRYFSAVDEIREPHAEPDGRPAYGRQRPPSPGGNRGLHVGRMDHAAHRDMGQNSLGKLPGSVWSVASEPLIVPGHLPQHFAAFPSEFPRQIILGWSPSGICAECGEGRRPVPTSVGLDMSRPQARRAHQLAVQAGLTEAHFSALLSVGVSDTGRGAATQSGTGKNTADVYARADEARAALGGYAREYLLRRPTGFGYACACTPYTDHPGVNGRERDGQAYARETGRDAHPHGGVGVLPRTGPWREYHFDRWMPAPTRPAVVVDPFGGTGTTALVAAALGRIGLTVDRSGDYCRLASWRTTDPGQIARVLGVPKPPVQLDGQLDLFAALSTTSSPAGTVPAANEGE